MLHDALCIHTIQDSPNTSIPWFLMASYAYYIEDRPILSDGLYDQMATIMLANWDSLEHHHKRLITPDG